MAYDKDELIRKSIEVVIEHKLFFIEDVIAFLPCSKSTFYNHRLHELDELKRELENNAIKMKVELRIKWFNSDNATLQLALMKLLATDGERKKLSQTYQSVEVEIEAKPLIEDNPYEGFSIDQLDAIYKVMENKDVTYTTDKLLIE